MTALNLSGDDAPLSPYVAAEIRAELGRMGLNMAGLARQLHRPQAYVSRRLGKTADVDLTFEDTQELTDVLGLNFEDIIIRALRARRDSNPKPSDP